MVVGVFFCIGNKKLVKGLRIMKLLFTLFFLWYPFILSIANGFESIFQRWSSKLADNRCSNPFNLFRIVIYCTEPGIDEFNNRFHIFGIATCRVCIIMAPQFLCRFLFRNWLLSHERVSKGQKCTIIKFSTTDRRNYWSWCNKTRVIIYWRF